MSYRVKQFIWAITAKVTEEESVFLKEYLTPNEVTLFNKLKVYEQKHCIKVAHGMATDAIGEEKRKAIRLGLLHDIGKIVYPIGPIRKSMMVLLHKFTRGGIARFRFSKMVRCYYEHPELGYDLLNKMGGYDYAFLQVIRDHHQAVGCGENKVLNKLRDWDDKF